MSGFALQFERSAAERVSDRRYRRKGASESIDKRRLPVADPGRRIRLAYYSSRVTRGLPVFRDTARAPSTLDVLPLAALLQTEAS